MEQISLQEFAIPTATEDIDEFGKVVNPRVVATCTKCNAVMKNMLMTVAEGSEGDDRSGEWIFSCRTNWCGTGTAGMGTVSVKMENGEMCEPAARHAEIHHTSVDALSRASDGTVVLDPHKYENAKPDQ